MEKSQNHIRIYDFKENKLTQLYSNTCNGNFICVNHRLIFLRLLVDNGIEVVDYDTQALKEIKRYKNPNDFEVSQVCIVEDHANILGIKVPEDIERNLIIAHTRGGNWEFRKVCDYGTILWKFAGYNLSIWSFYNDKDNNLLLWNQWLDRDKCYYEMSHVDGKNFELGKKVNHFNSKFQYLSDHFLHKNDKDKFVEIDMSGVKKNYAKDKDILKKFVSQTFEIPYENVDFTSPPCSMLVYNRIRDVYSFIYGDRKLHVIRVIES